MESKTGESIESIQPSIIRQRNFRLSTKEDKPSLP